MFVGQFRLQFCLTITYRRLIPKPELPALGIFLPRWLPAQLRMLLCDFWAVSRPAVLERWP